MCTDFDCCEYMYIVNFGISKLRYFFISNDYQVLLWNRRFPVLLDLIWSSLVEKKNNYTIHRNMIKYSNPSLVTQTILCNNPRHIFLRTCVLSNNYGHHTVGDFMYLYMIVLNTKLKMFRFVSLQIHFTDKLLKITIHLSILIFVMCRRPVT